MFRVENADFIADKLASELLPNQEYREVLKNAEEAIRRRTDNGDESPGQIEFDVDWQLLESTDNQAWFLSCADNGDGMSRNELEKYTTTLAVRGANQNQSLFGNQGMGLKISGPTRHKKGLIIRSMKNGECTMVQVGWNGTEYGLIPVGTASELISSVPKAMFPEFIQKHGSGTVVTFLGNSELENTFVPQDGRSRGWLFKYLNQRFYRLSDNGADVWTRVAAGDVEDWPTSYDDAQKRASKQQEGKSFNRTKVKGTATIWDEAAEKQDRKGTQSSEFHGIVELDGDRKREVPPARVHWWVLPSGPGSDVSTRTASGGAIAALYQNEIHDWRTSGQANPFFARMGVLFGKTRIAFIIEPIGTTVSSDFARAHVLVAGKPVFETEAWLAWADEFRNGKMPDAIKDAMAEEQSRLQTEDPDRAKRINDRLKDVMQLLRPRRGRSNASGATHGATPTVTGSGNDGNVVIDLRSTNPKPRETNKPTARGIGSLLTQVDDDTAQPTDEVQVSFRLETKWVTESEAEGMPIVSGDTRGLHDRAAALAGEDGTTASILLLNKEFRGYQAILLAVNDWANPDGDNDKAAMIEQSAQEWIEQKMIESVNGLRQLENGSTWTAVHYDDALSPVALTAAFMADRYHTLREVKRPLGTLRQTSSASK